LNRLSHTRRSATAAFAAALILVLSVAAAQAATKKVTLKSESVSSLSADVLAAPSGRTLYRLKPETAHHVLCTTQCLKFWKPLTVKSKTTKVKLPSGISGKIGFLSRGKNKFQVTLKGRPLYTFVGDTAVGQGNGQNIKSFGGTWFSLTVKKSAATTPTTPPPNTPYMY
jgi:predicted lipoprotein with Yx(FWY)xxD motif